MRIHSFSKIIWVRPILETHFLRKAMEKKIIFLFKRKLFQISLPIARPAFSDHSNIGMEKVKNIISSISLVRNSTLVTLVDLCRAKIYNW